MITSSAHAGEISEVICTADAHATGTKMMTRDVKAAVCSLKNSTFPSCNWSLETTVQLKENGYHTHGRLKCYVMA